MLNFIDTNILYYKYANKKYPVQVKGQNIVSINALEFLRNIEKVHNNRAKYHIPVASVGHIFMHGEFMRAHNRDRPFPKHVSDAIIFDFKQDYDSYALYNNETMTDVVNSKMKELFQLSISFMGKEEYKEIKSKFSFLIKNDITVHSISETEIATSYDLLDRFLKKHSIKEDFRNSWNDLLILAKVINIGGNLISTDKLLNNFAAKEFSASIKKNNDFIEFQFPSTSVKSDDDWFKKESKGYINRGWTFRMNKGKSL